MNLIVAINAFSGVAINAETWPTVDTWYEWGTGAPNTPAGVGEGHTGRK